MGAGEARRCSRVLCSDMFLEIRLVCKSCATVATNERPLAQVNFVHMPPQLCVSREELATGGALKRLLPQVDSLVVGLHNI